jgi:sugar phosphate permease
VDGGVLAVDVAPVEEEPEVSFTLRQALRLPVFWGLLVCVAIPPLVQTGAIFHQLALFSSLGWGTALVPSAFMAYAMAGAVTAYVSGVLLERIPSRVGVAVSLLLCVLPFAAIALPLAPVAGALVYGTLLGLASGVSASANAVAWPDYFGTESLGAVKGVVNAARNGATAVGPLFAAVLVAGSGSFASSLMAFGTVSALGALGALWLRKPSAAGAAVADDDQAPVGVLVTAERAA